MLPRHLRTNLSNADGAGCAFGLLLVSTALFAWASRVFPWIMWVYAAIALTLVYFVVKGLIVQHRQVRDESRWLIERTEYAPRQAWRIKGCLYDDEFNDREDGTVAALLFRQNDGSWIILWPLSIACLTGKKKIDWSSSLPASITVDFVKSYERIGRVTSSEQTVPILGEIHLHGPSVLRTDTPIVRVDRFEDLPPELVRQLPPLEPKH